MQTLSSLFRIWRNDAWVKPFFALYRKTLVLSIMLGVLTMVFACALMFMSGYLISISAEQPIHGVFDLFIPLALVQIFGIGKPFLGYFERLKSHDWVLHMTSHLRLKLFKSVGSGATLWSTTRRIGDALGLLSDDINHVQDLYLRTIFPAIIAVVMWIGVALFFGIFSPLFACAAALVIGVYVIVLPAVSVCVHGARRLRMKSLQDALYADAYDGILGIEDWVCSGRRSDYVSRMSDVHKRISKEKVCLARFVRYRNLFAGLLFGVMSIFVMVWAALHFGAVEQSGAAVGDILRPADWIAAFVLGFFPLLEAFVPLSDAALQVGPQMDAITRLNDLPAQKDDVFALSAEDNGAADAASPSATKQSVQLGIVLDDVHFAYESKEILSGISLAIHPGEKIALLGPSGAGKSTLVSLIRGDLAPTQGTVAVGPVLSARDVALPENASGGFQVTNIRTPENAHNVFSIVEQETYLFARSLLENVRLGDASISEDEVTQALKDVGLGNLLARLPRGLKTMVDEAGLCFSGGERHRIALARVLVRKTPIVIFDEPAAALDPCTEHELFETMLRVFNDRTLIVITHHLLDTDKMDRIIFLDKGVLTLEGSFAELEATSERFCTLLAFDKGAPASMLLCER